MYRKPDMRKAGWCEEGTVSLAGSLREPSHDARRPRLERLRHRLSDPDGAEPDRGQMGGSGARAARRRTGAIQPAAAPDRGHLAENAVADAEKPGARRAGVPKGHADGAGHRRIFDHAAG